MSTTASKRPRQSPKRPRKLTPVGLVHSHYLGHTSPEEQRHPLVATMMGHKRRATAQELERSMWSRAVWRLMAEILMPLTQALERRLIVSKAQEHCSYTVADPFVGLLETKGVHREPGVSSGGDTKSDPLEDKLHKPSLGEKIKAKLHKS
jgi:hypothetical protein